MNGDDGNGGGQGDLVVKLAFGLGALICLLTGLVLYLFAPQLGLDPATAELVAVAFLIAGAADYLVLHFWERIVSRWRQ